MQPFQRDLQYLFCLTSDIFQAVSNIQHNIRYESILTQIFIFHLSFIYRPFQ
jgi:hypothetical protein